MIEIRLTGQTLPEVQAAALALVESWRQANPEVVRVWAGDAPALTADQEAAVARQAEAEPTAAATEDAKPKVAMTVDQLIAGMTLKPTATSALGDGTRVSAGDHLMHGGEEWIVYQTYRGSVVAAKEDNTADVLKTENCTAASARTQASADPAPEPAPAPRPGTAAALIPPAEPAPEPEPAPAPTGPLRADEAQRLTEWLTEQVANGSLSVETVFDTFKEYGCSKVADLSAAKAAAFEASIKTKLEGASPAPSRFGF